MTDAPELLPCPFCGNADVSPKSEWIAHPVEYMGHVECGDCDTIGPLSKYKYDNEDEAIADGIAVWNTRADLLTAMTAERDALEKRQYALAYAIAGGEDAPGLLDSASTDDLCSMIRSERAQERDAQEAWAKIAATEAREAALREAAQIAHDYGETQYQANVANHPQYADEAQEDAQEICAAILALIDKGDTA